MYYCYIVVSNCDFFCGLIFSLLSFAIIATQLPSDELESVLYIVLYFSKLLTVPSFISFSFLLFYIILFLFLCFDFRHNFAMWFFIPPLLHSCPKTEHFCL